MPISLSQLELSDDDNAQALNRIMQDLPTHHPVKSAVQCWFDRDGSQQMYAAWFNDRMVAFALVENEQLRALAVHPATRRRGVARRVAGLLLERYPGLTVSANALDEPITQLVAQLRSGAPISRL